MSDPISLGVVMDPIQSIHPEKDSTLALLLKAQSRGFQLSYLEMQDLYIKYGSAWGHSKALRVYDDSHQWYSLGEAKEQPLDQFDVILMRKDPPVTLEYIYSTYILEHAKANGTLIINDPQSLRDANEKIYITWFPQCMPPTLLSANPEALKNFLQEQETVVFKPLAGMGGRNIFRCDSRDPNVNVILENLTNSGQSYVMAQRFIEEIYQGDKRILLIDGEPIPYALARVPKQGDFRGNLAAGGKGHGMPLSERDEWICQQVGPQLKEKGLVFVGIDVIGDYLTEINVTSPTCIRELEAEFDIDISGQLLDCITEKLDT